MPLTPFLNNSLAGAFSSLPPLPAALLVKRPQELPWWNSELTGRSLWSPSPQLSQRKKRYPTSPNHARPIWWWAQTTFTWQILKNLQLPLVPTAILTLVQNSFFLKLKLGWQTQTECEKGTLSKKVPLWNNTDETSKVIPQRRVASKACSRLHSTTTSFLSSLKAQLVLERRPRDAGCSFSCW